MFIIKKNWYELLKEDFEKPFYKELEQWLKTEYNTKTISLQVFTKQ